MLSQSDLDNNPSSAIHMLVSDFKGYIGLVKVITEILQNEGKFFEAKVSDNSILELLETLDMSGDELLALLENNEEYAYLLESKPKD